MNFLMVENKPLPPLVGVSSSTSECLRLVRDGRLARLGFGCWDALRILSLIVLAVTCKAVFKKNQTYGEMEDTGREKGNQYNSVQSRKLNSIAKVDKRYKGGQTGCSNRLNYLNFQMDKPLGCGCV